MMRSRPDVLVLGGGGVLGEAWMMGVLAGIEDATGFDLRDCDYYVGTSAGPIVAPPPLAGQPAPRPGRRAAPRGPSLGAPRPRAPGPPRGGGTAPPRRGGGRPAAPAHGHSP